MLEELKRIREALHELTRRQREVLELAHYGGLSRRGLAASPGIH